MTALIQRNVKLYFANITGVIMSCLGALIAFFIYVGFLQKNLQASWSQLPNATKILDLWMIAGIVAIAGITSSFQVLGQAVTDRESRAVADFRLSGQSFTTISFSYVAAGIIISFIMQVFVLVVMTSYFTIIDGIVIPHKIYLPALGTILAGTLAATLTNQVIVSFIRSSTTFSRLSAIIGTLAGFAVATYLPYGALTHHGQILVKLVPSSYETAALRSLLLGNQLPTGSSKELVNFLGISFTLHGKQLSRSEDLWLMLGMIIMLTLIVTLITKRKRNE